MEGAFFITLKMGMSIMNNDGGINIPDNKNKTEDCSFHLGYIEQMKYIKPIYN